MFLEILTASEWWYGGIFWFNPNIQSLAWWLTLALPSPHSSRITLTKFLAISASLFLCEEPSAATIVFDVKYAISPVSSNLVLSIILFWFYCILFETCKFFVVNKCRWYSNNKIVDLQALAAMKCECSPCLLTYITTWIWHSWDTSIDIFLWHCCAT